MFLRIMIYTLIQEVIIFGILLFGKNGVSLTNYIDISFLVSLITLLIGLFVYIMRSGFLDRVHNGFRNISRKIKREEESEFSDMMLSELVGLQYAGILISALLVMLSSILSLFL
ncbi:DUF3899 domain-containing protein [Listeria ivanovii]|uniref:DUF3899 domain-containing protein n=1 Tax=Listeria ivanovii (strain ATCC BAA-678 / PAM 55) TaxID=881621 RepID=G2ZE99_LISIP|nr:DUF3899 domain-containing protein [Listeria ivanovii]AHI56710.1 membrane protein [Listeria ivanovii WSLC3009]AIS66127.1 membrane protein [Listeria ivanovii subsp. ivanovii]MBC1760365.1 DUF3899 domain-containing protein [Listeria ivanovii]MBK3913852.1 DUF3899 domain-containing protein [Listeria ivanovii subsp. ivanovii]MBK3921310.1 DUF3899 domain-containing protein [Listeria ivanovii subsp. ivanovii]